MFIPRFRYKKYLWLILLVLVVAILKFGPSISLLSEDRPVNEKAELRRYKMLGIDSKRELSAVVQNSKMEKGIQGREILYVDLSDGSKFSLYLSSTNFNYEPSSLLDFLQVGDSLYKASGQNKLLVIRNGEEYTFHLGKVLRKE